MANKARKDNRTIAEKNTAQALENLLKKIGKNDPNEAQKKEIADLRNVLKAAKFKRLAQQRVTKAVKMIDNIGKLSGAGYVKTPQQIDKIVSYLGEAVNAMAAKFSGTKQAAQELDLS